MKNLFSILIFSVMSICVFAQEDFCGHAKRQNELFQKNPELFEQYQKEEQRIQTRTKEILEEWKQGKKRDTKYTIAMVFHIVHDNGPENVSDETIHQAIEAINKDFSFQNPFLGEVRSEFVDRIADCEIEFKLATLDPAGNCTNGIIRYRDSRTVQANENVKQNRQWDRTRYLNIWVVRSVEGAGAYAFYPGSAVEGDGVLFGYFYLGTHAAKRYNASVLAHEVGHYLNLPHCWGNSNDADLPNNCGGDDGVEDTPNTVGNRSCNINRVTCGSLDNVQNIMDYGGCSVMFTNGQKARMHAALESSIGARNNLHRESTLISVGANYTDEPDNLCFANFQSNVSQTCQGFNVQYSDLSFHNPTAWFWEFEGAEPATSTEKNPNVTYANSGKFQVKLTVTNASGTISETKNEFIEILPNSALPYPYYQDFENTKLANTSDFTVLNIQDDNKTWVDNFEVGRGDNSSIFLSNRLNQLNNVDILESTTFGLTNATDAVLSFDYAIAPRTPNDFDEIAVYISTDCGKSFSKRKTIKGSSLYTTTPTISNFKPTPEQWKTATVDLGSYVGDASLKFRIEFTAGGGNNVYMDNINLVDPNGINEITNELLTISPNPASNEIAISGLTGSFDITLVGIDGRVVKKLNSVGFSNREEQQKVDLLGLSNGIYQVVFSNATTIFSKKLILQNQ